MSWIKSFDPTIQEILLNNYLKVDFENSEIRHFATSFLNFIRGKSFSNFTCKYFENVFEKMSPFSYTVIKDFNIKVLWRF